MTEDPKGWSRARLMRAVGELQTAFEMYHDDVEHDQKVIGKRAYQRWAKECDRLFWRLNKLKGLVTSVVKRAEAPSKLRRRSR